MEGLQRIEQADHPPRHPAQCQSGLFQLRPQAPPAGVAQDRIQRSLAAEAVEIGTQGHELRMCFQQPQMDPVSDLKALPVDLPELLRLRLHRDTAISLPPNLLLRMEGKKLLHQNMVMLLRIQAVRIPALVNQGIGALSHDALQVTVQPLKREDGIQFQRGTMIHGMSLPSDLHIQDITGNFRLLQMISRHFLSNVV